MIAMCVNLFFAEGARWGEWGVKKGKTELTTQQKAVSVRGKAVVGKATR